jgi:uncharacterized protein (TIGR03083 family)
VRESPWAAPYEQTAERIEDLCSALPPSTVVPACPEWTVHDVVAHLTGLAQDWVAGDLASYASPEWTSRQVARFADRPVPEVLDVWRRARRSFGELPETPEMGDPAMWALGDALVHEADLHEAAGRGSRPPTEAMMMGVKFGLARWRLHLSEHSVSSLRIDVAGGRQYWCGAPDDEAPVLRAEAWELFRLLFGRRSGRQVARLLTGGERASLIEAGLPAPFEWSTVDLAG